MMLYKHSHQSYPPKSATMVPLFFDLYRQGYLASSDLTSAPTDSIIISISYSDTYFYMIQHMNFKAFKLELKKVIVLIQILPVQVIWMMRTWGHRNKVGCVFPMIAVSILPHAEFGLNGHWEDAPHFN